jgi:predicted  nucleic acid-binding Zn-ribbon protein
MGEDLLYFSCEDINKILKVKPNLKLESFNYNCNENTVSADVLFPPSLNPMTGEWETNIPDVFDSEIQLSQIGESKKQPESEISEFEIKKLISYAVEKEISKERKTTNSYIQENKNKISKLEDEIKSLKNRRPNTKPSNSSLFSSKNPIEILGVCCLVYLMLGVMTSF